jgi:Caspase recruitment domain
VIGLYVPACHEDCVLIKNISCRFADAAIRVSFPRGVERLKARLEEIVEPNYGLLPQLISHGVLADRERHRIMAENTTYDKVSKLIECLSNKSEALFELFFDALKATEQRHVVHFIQYPNGSLRHHSIYAA